jgi:hypothetical protein
MKIEQEFTVEAPADEVWAFLTDPERVAAALPGAEITEKVDDTTYKGGMSVKVGPLSATYAGTVSFELDEDARAATVHAKGQGKAGMGSADMRMVSNVVEVSDSETKVTVDSDLTVSGVLAQFGRGMIEQVSKKMFNEFTANVKRELEEA